MVQSGVQAAIEEVIRERLGTHHVIKVETVRDDDFDDEEVLWVTVVVNDADSDLDEDHVLGLVRYIQPRLDSFGETAFPVISFKSEQDHREAA